MNTLSFMGANFVARQNRYRHDPALDWGHYDAQCQEFFRPLAMYRERISALLDEVVGTGFDSLDMWLAHLHPGWATPEHIAIVAEELATRKLRVTSLAGGFGDSLPAFRACCRMAAQLDIPVLGGGTPLLESDRAGMVAVLREFGLIFALENHPEKSPAALLARLGGGDEDIMQVAPDTGWFGTQGYPADQALRELSGRIALVHLKDVLAAGAHDTCGFGGGVVPIAACLGVLRETGFTGPISIEHEPFDRDPRDECRAAREFTLRELHPRAASAGASRPVGIAILGCGNIAATYAVQLASYPEVRLLGASDIDPARTADFAAQHACRAYESFDALLADPDVEAVVNLTIHHAHYSTIKQCLEAGKHVHTEKPLATNAPEAFELVALTAAKGLRLSSAPTTWLGEAQQTAWAHLHAGRLGTPRIAYAEVNWGRIESWHPNPGPFYAVGPVFDVAVYPLTLLTAWFGPVREVIAGGGILYPHRQTNEGTPFEVESPDWSSAVLTFESGLMARLTSSFYVAGANSQGGLEIHGDAGSLRLGRWDVFDTHLEAAAFGKPMRRLPLARPGSPGIEFARGARDLALAIREDRPHRCTGAQAAHVVEVCEAILRSIRDRNAVSVTSSFPPPAPLEWAAAFSRRLDPTF